MWLIAGLGNPGSKYRNNRHNVGFMALDRIASSAMWKEKFKAEWTKVSVQREDVVLIKPQTFMNLSGESLQAALQFFKIEPDKLVVLHDELDLAWRDVRVKVGGGTAGHNGLKSTVQHCGPNFVRVRIGIGKPLRGTTESWVLGDFDAMESAELPSVLEQAALAVGSVVRDGPSAAQNKFNSRPKGT